MSFLLDTNICSAHMRRPAGLAHRFVQHAGRLYVPTVVLAELYAGAFLLDDPTRTLAGINDLLPDLIVLEFGEACAFLCAASSGFIVGQNLLLDGGAFNSTMG